MVKYYALYFCNVPLQQLPNISPVLYQVLSVSSAEPGHDFQPGIEEFRKWENWRGGGFVTTVIQNTHQTYASVKG